jgi:Spy/CpxP family protein refolding chaperone
MKYGILVCLGAALMFGQGGPRGFGKRAEADLGLTAAQQNTIHTVLADAQVQTKGMRDQERQLREQLTAAIKAGDENKIDSVTADLSRLQGQTMAIQSKAEAKVYGSLTADQKAKVDARPGGVGFLMRRGGPGGEFRRAPGGQN